MPKGNNKMIKKEPKNYFQRGLGALKTPKNGKIGAFGGGFTYIYQECLPIFGRFLDQMATTQGLLTPPKMWCFLFKFKFSKFGRKFHSFWKF